MSSLPLNMNIRFGSMTQWQQNGLWSALAKVLTVFFDFLRRMQWKRKHRKQPQHLSKIKKPLSYGKYCKNKQTTLIWLVTVYWILKNLVFQYISNCSKRIYSHLCISGHHVLFKTHLVYAIKSCIQHRYCFSVI